MMTTTLRPTEPLQRAEDGTRSRRYQVCVNSRPVGAIHLGTSHAFGDSVARIIDLRIEEPDRRRGRGTVAALAAEEVARGWGCERIEATVPAGSEAGLRLSEVLGYVLRDRGMEKHLGPPLPELPAGSRPRPMAEAEFTIWQEHESEAYARTWIERGVPEAEAYDRARRDHERLLPEGLATEDALFTVLEHQFVRVGTLWLALRGEKAHVCHVAADPECRGHGHGRTLILLAEIQALAAGRNVVSLNVIAGNTPAERLYASLGYATTRYALYKPLS